MRRCGKPRATTMMDSKENEPLAAHTTLQVGGPAEYFAVAHSEEELAAYVREAKVHGLPVTVLGGGSNVLAPDEGLSGLVLKNEIDGIAETDDDGTVLVTAGAGVVFDELVAHTVARGYWGLENLSHIPGSVGATPIQNVGAYGVEIGNFVACVRVYDMEKDDFRTLKGNECAFGYRDSIFKHTEGAHLIVTSVTFRLSRTPAPRLSYKDLTERFGTSAPSQQEIRDAVIAIRAKKFPDWHRVGTAGSFFKNPIITNAQFDALRTRYPELPGFPAGDAHTKVALGWILDRVCELRGVRVGNVGTYEGQALVLVNHGNATAREIEQFAHNIASRVHERTGINIEWEVTRLERNA